jgi:hypothetical protein
MSSPVATKGGSPSVETAMTGANSRIKVTNPGAPVTRASPATSPSSSR